MASPVLTPQRTPLTQDQKGYRYSVDSLLLAEFVRLRGDERLVHGKPDGDACMALLEGVCHGRSSLCVEPPMFLSLAGGRRSDELRRIEARSQP